MRWIGSYKHKGLAVFTFGEYRITGSTPVEPVLEWVMALQVQGPISFDLIAVWAMNQRASNITAFPQSNPQPAAALDAYWSDQSSGTIIAGDFNNNVRWDKPGTPDTNHAKTLAAAKRAGLTSAYHYAHQENKEKRPHPRCTGMASQRVRRPITSTMRLSPKLGWGGYTVSRWVPRSSGSRQDCLTTHR